MDCELKLIHDPLTFVDKSYLLGDSAALVFVLGLRNVSALALVDSRTLLLRNIAALSLLNSRAFLRTIIAIIQAFLVKD